MIIATALTFLLSTALGFKSIGDSLAIDVKGIIILVVLIATSVLSKPIFKKKVSPIMMILLSAALGILLYYPY